MMICAASRHLLGAARAGAIDLDLAVEETARLGEKSVDLAGGQDQPLLSTSWAEPSSNSSDWLEPTLSG